jgi:tetratricopeptide (TPR) repeat protein
MKPFLVACGLLACSVCGCSQLSSGDDDVVAGANLYESGKYREALERLKPALNKTLQSHSKSEVLAIIGNCYNQLDEYEQALDYQEQAIQADPSNHQAYVNKGVVHRLMGDLDAAAQCYDKAIALNPNYAEAYSSLGALAIFQDDPQKAIQHLERAIALNPSLAVSHANLALAYAAADRFDDADESLKKAILRGYDKSDVIKERIENLRRASE